jgi:cyanate permease
MFPVPIGHAPPQPDPAILATHALAGIGSGLVLALGAVAFSQRGSRSYLLVVLALAALVARTGVSLLAMFGPLGPGLHHFAEHGLDATVATFLLLAVYYARSGSYAPREVDP